VNFSVGTLDRDVWKLTEPGTPPPDRRIEALRRLTDAGVPCGVLVAPVLPGLSDTDEQLRAVVEACAAAGALSIHGVALHLRGSVRDHYMHWLARMRPDLSPALPAVASVPAPTRPRSSGTGSTRWCGGRPVRYGVTGRDSYTGCNR
jgi:DNA repair photolyase